MTKEGLANILDGRRRYFRRPEGRAVFVFQGKSTYGTKNRVSLSLE